MIPQRNLSLLSNRLARMGGRRIPESVLERDYCLALFLVGLSESDLRRKLAFKGWTALKRCYFADYRFSEDLDFTSVEPTRFEEMLRDLQPVYAYVREATGIEFAFDHEDRQPHANSHTFYLRYTGPLPAGGDVKVDITIREELVLPRTGLCCAPTTSSRTCPRTGWCRPILSLKSQVKSWSPLSTPLGTSRATFTTSGI